MGVFAVTKVYLPVNIEVVFCIKIVLVESFIYNLVIVGQIHHVWAFLVVVMREHLIVGHVWLFTRPGFFYELY